MKVYAFALASLFLTSCTTTSYWERADADRVAKLEAISEQARQTGGTSSDSPTCEADKCNYMWEAAQVWVSNNSAYKIQIATSAIISTYNSTRGSTDLAFKVTKEPIGSGKYKISMFARCDNILGCAVNPDQAVQNFNRHINSIK